MALIQTLTGSFKEQMLKAEHDLLTDTLKLALYTSDAILNVNTTAYTTSGEAVGTGYVAGGVVLTGATINKSTDGKVFVNFNNATFSAAVTARGGLIYNASKANKSVAVLDFGADKTSTTTFTVQMPANTASAALIRFP